MYKADVGQQYSWYTCMVYTQHVTAHFLITQWHLITVMYMCHGCKRLPHPLVGLG